jgi:hypothetical protein
VVLLVLMAVKLVSLNLVHAQTLDAYRAGDKERTLTWGNRQGWVNVVEPFRAPFAVGDAHVLTGHFALARPYFEEAFELVPKGGLDECKVRVNLGLTYEALGDAAKAQERTDEWKQYYDKGLAVTSGRPPVCDAPEGGQTGEQLSQAQQRMQDKRSDAAPGPDDPQDQQGDQQPSPTPQPTPTPDPDRTPSQEEQDYLQEQQRQNTMERNLQQNDHNGEIPGGDGQLYPKPW